MNFSSVLNVKNILLGLGIFAVVIAILGFTGKLPGFTDSESEKNKFSGNVTIWGTLPKENIQNILDLFNKNIAKTYTVIYKEIDEENFTNTLMQHLADGTSPDLIIAPYSYILQNEKRIFPITKETISEFDFRNKFVDQSSVLLSFNGYLGFPISVDPLVLYFNRDILSFSGVTNPPSTWDQFFELESKITRENYDGSFKISTIPFGTYNNIPHITDIVMAMIMQISPSQPISKTFINDANRNLVAKYHVNLNTNTDDENNNIGPLNNVLSFMKNFADSKKETFNWHRNMPNALDNFIAGNQAFYIGYSSEVNYIKNANQKLYFDYIYLPQIADSNISSTYGKMYVISILKNSPNLAAAYSTALALTTGEYSNMLSSSVGGVSAYRANINLMNKDQASQIFGRSALISKGFQDIHRNELEFLMRQAIESVYSGSASTVEASKVFSESLQEIYDNN